LDVSNIVPDLNKMKSFRRYSELLFVDHCCCDVNDLEI
jgi:hypothetical protein